jgi:hypothetical protein
MKALKWLGLYSLCFSWAVFCHAQTTFGDVRGVIRDQQDLALPGAQVIVHSLDENADHQVISDNDGNYLVANLKPGE